MKAKRLLRFIIDYKVENGGVSPSIREIGAYMGGMSTSVVAYYLNKLRVAGHITWVPGEARSIQVEGMKVVWVG